MEKRLKTGLICMILAVILMPLAFLAKDNFPGLLFPVLVLTMLLELIGLVFVILSMLKKRQS